ncbi:MAG: gliding motility-associated protein GldE [Mucinivorans sp.]
MIQFLEFSPAIIYLSVSLLVLLFLSALVSGSETAFFSLSPSELSRLDDQKSKGGSSARKLLDKPEILLSTILIFNNLVNIAAILVANLLIDNIIMITDSATLEFLIKIVVVTFVLLLFGEIMPKIFSNSHTYRFAIFVAPFIVVVRALLWPLSWLLTLSGAFAGRALGSQHEGVSLDTLAGAIQITESENEQDKKMLSGIVQFVGTEVVEIMKPRIDVAALDNAWDFDRVKREIIASPYSRLPLYESSVDQIRGIIHIKDLLPYLDRGADFDWQKVAREAYFVPENMKINDLLDEFQTRHKHICIVVDEYGGTLGIATLEDILEEIVGEISDESDRTDEFYKDLGNGNFLFEGSTHLVDFSRALPDLHQEQIDKEKGEADTLAGLMIEMKGNFFKVGDSVQLGRLTMRAEQVEGYRITKVHVHIKNQVE